MSSGLQASLLSQMVSKGTQRDKNLFRPLRDQLAGEINDTSIIDNASRTVNDPGAAKREEDRVAREAGRYGIDTPDTGFDAMERQRLSGLRQATTGANTMNNAQMAQYSLNTTRRNELLNSMRGLQGAAADGASSVLQAEQRRKSANDAADAQEKASQQQAAGAAVGIVIAIA